jgi:hypothetical protein
VWGLGLLIVVGVAVAGGALDRDAVPPSSATQVPRASGAAPVAGAVSSIDPLSSVVFLSSPATTDQVLTTATVVIRGDVRMGIARIQVLLQSRSAEPIVVQTVGPMNLDWHRDGPRRVPFDLALALPDPRPSGPAVVQIVAYDAAGHARGIFLRRILIGALVDPTYGSGAMRPPTGEDGLMGGITSGTNFAWQARVGER